MVGTLVHGALLVPWRAWQRSHALHHQHTGHLQREEVFRAAIEPESVGRRLMFRSGTFILYGWPLYLLGLRNPERASFRHHNHFLTGSDLYEPRQRLSYLAGSFTCLAFLCLYLSVGVLWGWDRFALYVLLPYGVFATWLTLVTYLHHAAPETPIYADGQWTPLNGALATVDRDYGWFNWLTHRIGDQHVIHHLFPGIPHYHAERAMRAVEPLLGERRLRQSGAVWGEFLRSVRGCQRALPGVGSWRWGREREVRAG